MAHIAPSVAVADVCELVARYIRTGDCKLWEQVRAFSATTVKAATPSGEVYFKAALNDAEGCATLTSVLPRRSGTCWT